MCRTATFPESSAIFHFDGCKRVFYAATNVLVENCSLTSIQSLSIL